MKLRRGCGPAVAIVVTLVGSTIAAGLGWWNFLGAQMVSRGDIREACYLAIAFDDFREQQGKMPSEEDIGSFSSRLRFLRTEGDDFFFACGLYGRDLLVIQPKRDGGLDFYVIGGGNS